MVGLTIMHKKTIAKKDAKWANKVRCVYLTMANKKDPSWKPEEFSMSHLL